MRILHLTPYYAPAYAFGGVVRSVEGLARAQAQRGHTVTVLTTDAFDQTARFHGPSEESRDGVRVRRVRNRSPWLRGRLNLSTPSGLRAQARALLPEADVVHCHEFRTIENLALVPLAARAGLPLALSPHGTLARSTGRSALKTAWDRLLSPALARRFGAVVGLTAAETDAIRALWAGWGLTPHIATIPNGVNPADFADLPGRAAFRARYGLDEAPVCLFLARLHPRKGVGILAEAFRQADVPGARLVIAGPDDGMRSALQALDDPRLILTGYLGGADRLAALAAADVFALPAVGEGLPMAALEAMAAGLPVILSPGCYLPEAAAAGAGLEVEAAVEPLAAALRSLLTDPDQRARMGAAARALVQARFTWDAAAAAYETVYDRVVSP